METNKPLLLLQFIFNGADVIDCIRQSCIDLNETNDSEIVNDFLEEAIQYLDNDISYDVANELIFLIEKCFSYLSADPLPYLSSLFQKAKTNSFYLISFITVLSYLINNKPNLNFSQYSPFVEEAIKEIIPQIQNYDKLILFGNEIPFQYKDDVIINLLLSANLTKEIVDNLKPFLTNDDLIKNSKFKSFVGKCSDAGFASDLLITMLTNCSEKKKNDDSSAKNNGNKIDLKGEIKETDEPDEDDESEFDFITDFLESSNPEIKKDLKKSLFQNMLHEKSNLAGYLQIVFENIQNAKTKPKELLENFGELYEMDKKMFIEILNNVLVLHPKEEVFIAQPKYNQLALLQSSFNERIINKLFRIVRRDPDNYKAYYCLECIANSFPFIFASNPRRVFEIVLPAFENFQYIFEKYEKDRRRNDHEYDSDDSNSDNCEEDSRDGYSEYSDNDDLYGSSDDYDDNDNYYDENKDDMEEDEYNIKIRNKRKYMLKRRLIKKDDMKSTQVDQEGRKQVDQKRRKQVDQKRRKQVHKKRRKQVHKKKKILVRKRGMRQVRKRGMRQTSRRPVKKDSDKEKKENRGKAALAATSFLLYTLNSTKVFDEFMRWLFDNYKELTISQISCIIYIFAGCSASHLMHYITAYFKKYNIFNIINDWFQREVPTNLFGINFNCLLYNFLLIQHRMDQVLDKYETITIDVHIKRDQIFYEGSGMRLTHSIDYIPPLKIKDLMIDKEHTDPMILLFFIANDDFLPSFLEKSSTKISDKQVEDFLEFYKELIPQQEAATDFTFPEFTPETSIQKTSKLASKEQWVMKYIMREEKFPLLSEHQRILAGVTADLTTKDDSDHSCSLQNFEKKDYFLSYRGSKEQLSTIITRLQKTFIHPIQLLEKCFEYIPFNYDDYETVFHAFKDNFQNIETSCPYYAKSTQEKIDNNLKLLASFAQNQQVNYNDSTFNNIFFELCGNYILNFVLKPQYRYNIDILKSAYNLFKVFSNYPSRLLHLIGFMILTNDVNLKNDASSLCFGFVDNEKDLNSFTLLSGEFEKEFYSEKPNMTFISNLVRASSDIRNSHRKELLDMLEEILGKLQNGKGDKDEEFAVHLLDMLSPDRSVERTISITDPSMEIIQSKEEQFRFCPIPDFIYNLSPDFWKLFIKYRSLINKILLNKYKKNEKSEIVGLLYSLFGIENKEFQSILVCNYPECFNFDFRTIFFRQLIHNEIDSDDKLNLEIDNNNILQDSFQKLHTQKPKEWKKKLFIKYKNNPGLDAGGLAKDWLTKLTNELIDPKLQIFDISEKNKNLLPSQSSTSKSPKGLEMLKFAGMIIARALMQGELVPAHFTKSFLKQILKREKKINLDDLADADPTQYDSLQYYRDLDFEKNPNVEVYFEMNDDKGDTIELVENGSKKRVTNDNKNDYINLCMEYRLIHSISQQVSAFCEGFDSIIPHAKIRMFSPTELDLLICGVPNIDVDDLMRNADYTKPYNADSPAVKMFFGAIRKWDNENLTKLLIFITGTSRVPLNGFAFYKQINNPIKIAPGGESRLPCAHTCTNTLDLPSYESEEELNSKFLIAISVDDFQMK